MRAGRAVLDNIIPAATGAARVGSARALAGVEGSLRGGAPPLAELAGAWAPALPLKFGQKRKCVK